MPLKNKDNLPYIIVRTYLLMWSIFSQTGLEGNGKNPKHVLKVYFKLSRKNPDFGLLTLLSKSVWLKTDHLKTM